MKFKLLKTLVATAFFCPILAFSTELHGTVIGVSDGDTLTLLVEQKPVKIRLTEIDAPEKSQAFGQKSKQSLSELCFQKDALVVTKKSDKYGRLLGRIYCDEIDANAEQIRRGMAWVYDKYVSDNSLYADQDEARDAKLGLWADDNPQAPWDWRQDKKNKRKQIIQ
ncbi:MAG: thermonuclease family protein [bacterium]|nr:thermonuclease family protein [bacterium]